MALIDDRLRRTNVRVDELDVREEANTIRTRRNAHKRGRGYLVVVITLIVAGLALFARIETSSCVRSNEIRGSLNATAKSFKKIAAEYAREAREVKRYSAVQRADFLTRSRNLGGHAMTQHVRPLHCSLPFPDR